MYKLIKPVHGVNGSPISIAPGYPDLEDQFNEMGIPFIRAHDLYGPGDIDNGTLDNKDPGSYQLLLMVPEDKKWHGRKVYADLTNKRSIFPNARNGMKNNSFEEAVSQANYEPTDAYFRKIINNERNSNPYLKREVMCRIGRSFLGSANPPENFQIYAMLAAELVKRYSVNYMNIGMKRPVMYYQIWNEPDLGIFFADSDPKVYYKFYGTIAREIKKVAPNVLVGGPSIAAGQGIHSPYGCGFLKACKDNSFPLDFYSWHLYLHDKADPVQVAASARLNRSLLDELGFKHVESYITEWGMTPYTTHETQNKMQSAKNAAFIIQSLIFMVYRDVDKAFYYRADGGTLGIFNDGNRYTYPAQAFYLFNLMFETPYYKSNIDIQFENAKYGYIELEGRSEPNSFPRRRKLLVSTYFLDKDFLKEGYPSKKYKQYYLDTNRDVDNIQDQYSIDKWFGGKNPKNMYSNNIKEDILDDHSPEAVNPEYRRYGFTGHNAIIQDPREPRNVTAYIITEGGQLDNIRPSSVMSENIKKTKVKTDTGIMWKVAVANIQQDSVVLLDVEYS
ncbi:GH39 family glycosyl hydrolase [Photorhabdus stackebrandtii]|uniref:Glycoside hydrolase family 39 n=1 Tax=Photorhabdus stackebrandtii TaxID=1123042 RepID=A0A7X5QJL3_9GAMM|nr:glycosyl hydrolase [Photorhabdus stackebrandtii]NHB95499.1 glycoside hydrolase family 39 [Photorhabdus stackebrandtii]